jgi:hypothetical protein
MLPSPDMMAQTEETVVNDILEGLNQNKLDSKYSVELLGYIGRIIEIGMKVTRGTTPRPGQTATLGLPR